MDRRGARGSMLAAAMAAMVGAVSCTPFGTSAHHPPKPPCSPASHQLLAATLRRLAPSPQFSVAAHVRAWASTPDVPDQDQLFSGVGGMADVSVIAADASPRTRADSAGGTVSADPTVNLRATNRWYRLPVGAGTWRLYTNDLGAAVRVTVIGCPT